MGRAKRRQSFEIRMIQKCRERIAMVPQCGFIHDKSTTLQAAGSLTGSRQPRGDGTPAVYAASR
jgi:hypothetical protein